MSALAGAASIVAQVGIAGSAVLEDFVQVGGQAAIAGHLRIGQGAQDRRAGGRDVGRARGRRPGRQPCPAEAGVLPAGGRPEAHGAPAGVRKVCRTGPAPAAVVPEAATRTATFGWCFFMMASRHLVHGSGMLAGVAEQDGGPEGRIVAGADVVDAAEAGGLLGGGQHLIADRALHRFGGKVLRLPDQAVEGLALAAALRRGEGVLPDFAVEALGRLRRNPVRLAGHPVADFRPAVRQRVGVLPDGEGDDIALLAGERRLPVEARLAFEHRDKPCWTFGAASPTFPAAPA